MLLSRPAFDSGRRVVGGDGEEAGDRRAIYAEEARGLSGCLLAGAHHGDDFGALVVEELGWASPAPALSARPAPARRPPICRIVWRILAHVWRISLAH